MSNKNVPGSPLRFDGDCVDHFLQLSHLYHLQDSWWCLVIHHSHQHLGVFDAAGERVFFFFLVGSTGVGYFFLGGKKSFWRWFCVGNADPTFWVSLLNRNWLVRKSLGGWWSQGGIRWILVVAGIPRMQGAEHLKKKSSLLLKDSRWNEVFDT